MPMKPEINNVLRGVWQHEMMNAPMQDPLHWCYGLWCPCCFSYQQRHKVLDITGEPYICCGGVMPCCAQPCDSRDPWLCLEACCCVHTSILSNRFVIQTRFDIANDPCDETLLQIMMCLNIIADFAQCCCDRETAENARCLSDLVNACVCSCMLTQQNLELQRIEQALTVQPYAGPPPYIFAVLPPAQQQMVQASQAFQHGPIGPMQPPPQVMQPGMPQGVPPGVQQGMPPGVQPAPALAAQGRTIMLTVPPNTFPGQSVQFQTPEGMPQQVVVPPGVAPGQQFTATY